MNANKDAVVRSPLQASKVAIVHDWLYTYAGAERVLEQLIDLFPSGDLFSLIDFVPEEVRGFLRGKRAQTSPLQHFPFARSKHRAYLPLMPLLVEQFDLSKYDVVISSSHAIAKGVLTGPDQLHVSYVHSPMRYAWDLQHQYLREAGLDRNLKGWIARWVLHRLRIWDVRTANGVDEFVANSHFIARRIRKIYRRSAAVIYPPVDLVRFAPMARKERFFLTASRFVPYKRIDLIVEAFGAMPDKRLVVIGDGPDERKIKQKATRNVELLGYQPQDVLVDYMRRAQAFIFAAEDDFGIAPVEAQACGTPVLAFGRGGACETVRPLGMPRPTGLFFHDQSIRALVECVAQFEQSQHNFSAEHCRQNAELFSVERFRSQMETFLVGALDRFRERPRLETTKAG